MSDKNIADRHELRRAVRGSTLLKPTARFLWEAVAGRNGKRGYCFPSIEALMNDVAVKDEDTVRAGLKQLKKFGLLRTESRPGRASRYFLTWQDPKAIAGDYLTDAERREARLRESATKPAPPGNSVTPPENPGGTPLENPPPNEGKGNEGNRNEEKEDDDARACLNRSPEGTETFCRWLRAQIQTWTLPSNHILESCADAAPTWTFEEMAYALVRNKAESSAWGKSYRWFPKVIADIYGRLNGVPPCVREFEWWHNDGHTWHEDLVNRYDELEKRFGVVTAGWEFDDLLSATEKWRDTKTFGAREALLLELEHAN